VADDIIMGLDVGYGYVKSYMKQNGVPGKFQAFPRLIAKAPEIKAKEVQQGDVFGMGKDRYIVGDRALSYAKSLIENESREYMLDDLYWLCVGKALFDSGVFDNHQDIEIKRLVLGIAPGYLNPKLTKQMREKAKSQIQFSLNEKMFSFRAGAVNILPQGAGSYFCQTIGDNGKPTDPEKDQKLFGVIDFGFRTVDYLTFENQEYIPDPEAEQSEDTGVRYILSQLLKHCQKKFDYKGQHAERLEPALRGVPVAIRGKDRDLSAALEGIVVPHLKNVQEAVVRRWESYLDDMYKIIISGGGAHLFRLYPEFLSDYKRQIVFPDNPVSMNAMGFFRFGMLMEIIKNLK